MILVIFDARNLYSHSHEVSITDNKTDCKLAHIGLLLLNLFLFVFKGDTQFDLRKSLFVFG